jgi:hypothetical protein
MRKVLAISMVLATAIYGGRVEPQGASRQEDAVSELERVHPAGAAAAPALPDRRLADGNVPPKRPNRHEERNGDRPLDARYFQGQPAASV